MTDRNSKYLTQIEKHLNAIHRATKEEVSTIEEFKDIIGDIMLRSALAMTYLEPMLRDKEKNH